MDNEMLSIKKIVSVFPRHPAQLNNVFEADAEILPLQPASGNYLVTKVDSIEEEISTGLYSDPFLIGWMSVTVSLSDLAAAGADPLGVLLALKLPYNYEESWMNELQKGVCAACNTYDTFILGGDTNFANTVSATSTSIGTALKPMFRKQIRVGDLLYSTGCLGTGNSFAYSLFFDRTLPSSYQPLARLKESKTIREFASACMDTSDGFFPALSVLSAVNHLGFQLHKPLKHILCPVTQATYQKTQLPAWIFLAGPHGEYELVFTIPTEQQIAFEQACLDDHWQPVLLGEAVTPETVSFQSEEICVSCRPFEISNLFQEAKGNIQHYFQLLMRKHQQWSTTNIITTVC